MAAAAKQELAPGANSPAPAPAPAQQRCQDELPCRSREAQQGLRGWAGRAGPDALGGSAPLLCPPLCMSLPDCRGAGVERAGQKILEGRPGLSCCSCEITQGVLPPPLWRLPLRAGKGMQAGGDRGLSGISLAPCSLPSITLSAGIRIRLPTAESECALGRICECLGERKDTDRCHGGRFHPDPPDPDLDPLRPPALPPTRVLLSPGTELPTDPGL